jgi:hypothetical protein
MFASCGWFFEDLSCIEPRMVIAHAARAIHLIQQATGISLRSSFRQGLGAPEVVSLTRQVLTSMTKL